MSGKRWMKVALVGLMAASAMGCGQQPGPRPTPMVATTSVATGSPGATGSPSLTGSPTGSPSGTGSPTGSPVATTSPGATGSPAASPTSTASPTASPTTDASPTPSARTTGTPDASNVVVVTLTDNGMTPQVFRVPNRKKITFRVINKSTKEMGLKFEGLKQIEEPIPPGEEGSIVMDFGPGKYVVRQPGMEGNNAFTGEVQAR